MRLNIYAEEISERIEIIEKETKDGKFTGLRIYLELPVTELVCSHCGTLERFHKHLAPKCPVQTAGEHVWHVRQLSGAFMHHDDDDDSSAVTFWGKCAALETFEEASRAIKKHYGMKEHLVLELPEEDRQLVLLALAVLSLESPGFDHALNEIAKRIDNTLKSSGVEDDLSVVVVRHDHRAETYDKFRAARRKDAAEKLAKERGGW